MAIPSIPLSRSPSPVNTRTGTTGGSALTGFRPSLPSASNPSLASRPPPALLSGAGANTAPRSNLAMYANLGQTPAQQAAPQQPQYQSRRAPDLPLHSPMPQRSYGAQRNDLEAQASRTPSPASSGRATPPPLPTVDFGDSRSSSRNSMSSNTSSIDEPVTRYSSPASSFGGRSRYGSPTMSGRPSRYGTPDSSGGGQTPPPVPPKLPESPRFSMPDASHFQAPQRTQAPVYPQSPGMPSSPYGQVPSHGQQGVPARMAPPANMFAGAFQPQQRPSFNRPPPMQAPGYPSHMPPSGQPQGQGARPTPQASPPGLQGFEAPIVPGYDYDSVKRPYGEASADKRIAKFNAKMDKKIANSNTTTEPGPWDSGRLGGRM